MSRRSTVCLLRLQLVAVIFQFAGCGPSGPEIAHVSGKVTMDGKPIPYAAVVFIPENGRPAGAMTDENGNYVLNFTQGRRGAIPGKSIIRITTNREAQQDASGKPIPGSKETIPAEYNTNSKLEFTVEPKKKNIANFDLVSSKAGPPKES